MFDQGQLLFPHMLAGHLSVIHFAPTKSPKENSLRENICKNYIHVTGNAVIDALLETAREGMGRKCIQIGLFF